LTASDDRPRPSPPITGLGSLIPYLTERKFLLGCLLCLGLAAYLVESVGVSFVTFLIFRAASPPTSIQANGALGALYDLASKTIGNSLPLTIFIVFALVLLRASLIGGYGILAAALKNRSYHRIRSALYRKYMFIPYAASAAMPQGAMINTLQNESWKISEIIEHVSRIVIAVCATLVYLTVIAIISWPVAVIIALEGLLLTTILRLLRQPLSVMSREATAQFETMAIRMVAGIQALRTIRVFGAERQEAARFDRLSSNVSKILTDLARIDYLIRPLVEILSLVMVGGVIFASLWSGNSNATTITIVALLFRLQPSFKEIQQNTTSIVSMRGSLEIVARDLALDDRPVRADGEIDFSGLDRDMEFDKVSFAYPGAAGLSLSEATFRLRKGRTTAIFGRSGAGKTTVVNLLLRLYEPQKGSISVNGVPLSQFSRESWLKEIRLAGQDIELIDGTILENLSLGAPDLTASDALRMLELVGIGDFIATLPDGVSTLVGERGVRLSGGQRQRISLARALLGRPSILILDEATNAVDAKLEDGIHRSIRAAFPDITIIIIAHNKALVDTADDIVMVANSQST